MGLRSLFLLPCGLICRKIILEQVCVHTARACHSDKIPVATDSDNRFIIFFFGLGVPKTKKYCKFKFQTCEIIRSSSVVWSEEVFLLLLFIRLFQPEPWQIWTTVPVLQVSFFLNC